MGQRLTFRGLVALAFVLTCAGPFGLEAAVRAAGPMRTLLGLALLPVFVIVPQIAVTAELSCMMPHPAGYLHWVQRAHGTTAGALNAANCAVSILTDMAVYPVLALEYFTSYGVPLTPAQSWAAKASVVGFGLVVNAVGLQTAGNCMTVLSVALFVPFIAGATVGAPQLNTSMVTAGVPQDGGGDGPVDWGLFLSVLLWLYGGWECLGCVASEVTDVRRVFAPAMLVALLADLAAYAGPLLAALPAAAVLDGSAAKWEDGALARYYEHLVPGLGITVAVAAFVSNAGLFAAKLLTNARALLGVADAWYGRPMQRVDEPAPELLRGPLVLQGMASLLLVAADFAFLVKITMLLTCAAQLFELTGFLRLRYTQPSEPRPVRVPGGAAGAWGCTAVTCAACVAASAAVLTDPATLVAAVVLNAAAGFALWRRAGVDQPADKQSY